MAESEPVDGQDPAPQRRRLLMPKSITHLAKLVHQNASAPLKPQPPQAGQPTTASLLDTSKRSIRVVRKPAKLVIRALLSHSTTVRQVALNSPPNPENDEVNFESAHIRRFAPQPSVMRNGKRLRVLSSTAIQSAQAAVLAIAANQRRTGSIGSRRYLSTGSLVLRQGTARVKSVEMPSSFKSSAAATSTMSFLQAKAEQSRQKATPLAPNPLQSNVHRESELTVESTAALVSTGSRRIIISQRQRVLSSAAFSPKAKKSAVNVIAKPIHDAVPIVVHVRGSATSTSGRAAGFLKAMQSIRSQK